MKTMCRCLSWESKLWQSKKDSFKSGINFVVYSLVKYNKVWDLIKFSTGNLPSSNLTANFEAFFLMPRTYLQKDRCKFSIGVLSIKLNKSTSLSLVLALFLALYKDIKVSKYVTSELYVIVGLTNESKRLLDTFTEDLVNKGTKAMYEVLKKGRLHNLSIQCQLDIFDKTVKPILL